MIILKRNTQYNSYLFHFRVVTLIYHNKKIGNLHYRDVSVAIGNILDKNPVLPSQLSVIANITF